MTLVSKVNSSNMSQIETTTIGILKDARLSAPGWNVKRHAGVASPKIDKRVERLFLPNINIDKTKDYGEAPCEFDSVVDDSECVTGTCPCSDVPFQIIRYEMNDVYQWSDYVTHPMIWCEACGRRSFLCISCKPDLKESEDGRCLEYTYPLVNVIGVRNYQLYDCKWTDDTYAKYFDELLKVEYHDQENFCQERGIEYCGDDDDRTYKQDWSRYVKCNSSNTEDVEKPIDMAHDGIYVYCLCECKKCGVTFQGCYWGD